MRHKNSRDQGPGGSQRQLRVGELVRHAVAEMLTRGDVHDPVIERHLITIPEVRMSPDLKLATIYVMPMGGRDAAEVVAAFDKHKKFLRAEIAHEPVGHVGGMNLAVDLRLAHPARDELRVLRAEVEDQDALVASRRGQGLGAWGWGLHAGNEI